MTNETKQTILQRVASGLLSIDSTLTDAKPSDLIDVPRRVLSDAAASLSETLADVSSALEPDENDG